MHDPFDTLRRRFIERCCGELAALEVITRKHDAVAVESDRDFLVKTAHALAGAGGTFGFPGLSERASNLETLLITEDDPGPAELQTALDELVMELKRVTN